MASEGMSESADLGAEWGSQAKKDHDDHLNNPTNVAIREATALKEKGNTDFGREAFDDAVSAYSAGAAAAARVEGNYRAKVANDLQTACLCNAAQARLKQERWPEAAELCTRALAVDGKCVKALFRRGCAQLALKDYEKARRDLALAAELEPSNKSITSKLIEAERVEMQDAKKAKGVNDYDRFAKIDLSDDEDQPAAKPDAGDASQRSPPAKPPAPAPAPAPKSTPPPRPSDDSGDVPETKPAAGYRYWAKTPSVPRVIPQKIDPALAAANEAKSAGSVWNAAGTYEEKDQTEWAKACLAELLSAARTELDGGGCVRCMGAKNIAGDVGIHVVRGKKRFLFDLKLSVPFEVELPDSEKLFSGEIEVTDFSSHDQADWESSVTWNAKPPPGTELYTRASAAVGKGLAAPPPATFCAAVAAQMSAFIAAFKER
ncbi:hypothetical protein KFE25_008699 [Diacronema lutheri]|uniref:Activator of Hsp90 ATPase AHSA1-like N-terminal domain-containing protein n=2 Tax=Diacronema lutheri TaxID=2081491 RepID=A0A8J5XRC0_DIALT|nr:hypothetical protein KFE25_008699 [Diacronema lutheri]